ncbi:MAG TPA: arabinosyltransferase domain-containing protein [Pseudonocardia sp.]
MLTPAREAPPSEPDVPAPPLGEPAPGAASRWVLVLGLVATLAALVFPFAPVTQPEVSYRWSAADGAAALPLMPYQPVALSATIGCAVARDAAPGSALLSTVPLSPDPSAQPLTGLRLTADGGGVLVASGGVDLGRVPLPAGPCTLAVTSDPRSTAVLVDGRPVLTRLGDVRPAVAGAFSDVDSGVTLALTADTRFQTAITPVKAAIAAVGVLALLGMLVAVRRADARVRRRVRLLPPRWWRPRLVDVAVTALLGVWWVIGAVTVDDGYIAGIVRSRGENGFVGNVYRWLNAPESPFSWFYDLLYPWSEISASTLWMRLPATLLGLVTWVLLSRFCLPRLGPFARRRTTPWIAALAFATWWVPLCLGLRPEPWVAVGLLGCWLLVERAVATRGLLPLVCGLVLAGVTTALTPGGLVAFTPFVGALLPVLRLLRARSDLHRLPVVAALVAAPVSAVLLMVYDQSFSAMLESTRVRSLIGGGAPWYAEAQRYGELLSDDFQGSIGRRAAVLTTLLAAAAALWALRRGAHRGIATGPGGRLVVALLLALAVMTFTPTKWTQHFGDLAGIGAAVLTLGAAACAGPVLRGRPRAMLGALAAATAVGAVVLAGPNNWPFVAQWFTPPFSSVPAQVRGIPLATMLLVAGGVLVAVLVVRALWRRAGGGAEPAIPRRVPGPVPIVVLVLVVALALQVLGLARGALAHRNSYTLASDAVATLRGDPCGLQRTLSVETNPAAGVLPARSTRAAPQEQPVDIGGSTVAGMAVAGRSNTAWFTLVPQQRSGALPVVVTTVGTLRPGDVLQVQFGDAAGAVLASRPVTTAGAGPADVRQIAPAGAEQVRLLVDASTAGAAGPAGTVAGSATTGGPAAHALVTLPRVPLLTPMEQLLPRGTRAILDWPVAFLFPCLVPEPLPLGTAGVAAWRVAPPAADPAADITYAPGFGGPFVAPRLLVTQQRLPTYLAGDPTREAVQLFRWVPTVPLATPAPTVVERTVAGWASDGHARVPGLDPVG